MMTQLSARVARWTLLTAAMVAVTGLSSPAALAASSPGVKTVSYLGYSFEVPAAWPVIRTGPTSTTCVRFDRHAIYLGDPGQDQNCPAGLLGTTEAILVQPAAGTAAGGTSAAEDPVARKITVVGPGVEVTATYDTRRAVVARILAGAGLPVPPAPGAGRSVAAGIVRTAGQGPAPDAAAQVVAPAAAPAILPGSTTSYLGQGFDACAAPSPAVMSAWKASSPYGAVGIYIGGADMACAQPNLTAGWVAQQAAAGWHFLPTYVGPQAEFGEIKPATAASQGVTAAQDAVTQAAALGFGPGTPVYYDMEAYPAGQESSALAFLSAWTTQLHAEGYKSGVYSSSSSGVSDLVAQAGTVALPDVIWDAWWNGAANTADPQIPAADWAVHQRAHQFSGNVNETYRGDTINVDQDYLDVNVRPPGPAEPGQAALVTESGQVCDYVIRGRNLYTYYQASPGGGFSGPKELTRTGDLAGTPVAAQAADGAISVFAATTGGTIAGIVQSAPGGPATTSISLSTRFAADPAMIAAQNGTVALYLTGTDRNLYTYYQARPGGAFTGPKRLTSTGNLAGSPSAVQNAQGVISVYVRTTAGGLRAVWESAAGGAVTKSASLGGHLAGNPAAVVTGDGAIAVYAVGTNGQLYGYEQRKPGGLFVGPAQLTSNGGLTGTPVAMPGPAGTVSVYVRGGSGSVRARWQSAAYGSFSQGATLGGDIAGGLAGVAAGDAVWLYGTGGNGRQYGDDSGATPGSFSGWAVI
jgi:hypothetical protein